MKFDPNSIVTLVNSDSIRPEIERLYSAEERRLSALLTEAKLEHVGGTSLPNSPTKGDLDIQIRVNSDSFETAKELMSQSYEPNVPERWTSGWASYNKKISEDERPVGYQLTVVDSEFDEFYKLRDRLISDKGLLKKYNDFKRSFEGKTHAEYRQAKDSFFGPNGSNKLLDLRHLDKE